MTAKLEVLFTPAEFTALAGRDLTQATCVVFDVLRATSTIVAALANGAAGVMPAAEISEAVALRRERPDWLLAGERDGLRIHGGLTGGTEFDLGNSPREFKRDKIRGRTIVLTTTNGSRALRACSGAREALAGSFLNLSATAEYLKRQRAASLLLVCSGTGNEAAFEDVLGAGALAELMWGQFELANIADSAAAASQLYQLHARDLPAAMSHSRNARRLLAQQDLKDDVIFCLQRDVHPLVGRMENGVIREVPPMP